MNTENKANIEEKIEESVAKARQMMREGKDKLGEMAKREEVQQAKTKFLEEWTNTKSWCFSNWNAGRYGKFRVIAVAVLVALALRGLLCGWGGESDSLESQREIAEMQKETAEMQAGAALVGALLGGGGGGGGGGSTSSSSAPRSKSTMNLWTCAQCGRQIESTGRPSGIKCPAYPNDRSGRDRCSFRLTR